MDLFLIHCLLLVWMSLGAARHLTARITDRLLAGALLGWGNIVATSLLLSTFGLLGDHTWFLASSTLLSGLIFLWVRRLPVPDPGQEPQPAPCSGWWLGVFVLTLAPLAAASFLAAYSYEPNNAGSLTHHLPRAMYYLGQHSLAPFGTPDPQQTQLPFNYNLLQLFVLIYGAPLPGLNFFNLGAWALGGAALYRLGRLCGAGGNASLIACWLVLAATGAVAQAAATTPEPAVGAALLCTGVFLLQWRQRRLAADAWLAGLAAGLAAGSDARALLLLSIGGPVGLLLAARSPGHQIRSWSGPGLLAAGLGFSFAAINLLHGDFDPLVLLGLARDATTPVAWSTWWPLLPMPAAGIDLNEDTVGFGLAGALVLSGGLLGAFRLRSAAAWAGWSALAWIAIVLLSGRFSFHPRDLIPALLFLGPGMALMLEAGIIHRVIRGLGLMAVALLTLWSASVYLLKNTSRPLEPLLKASFVPPGLPSLPLLVEHRMAHQPWVNVESDSPAEKIFPFMARGRNQRFTSGRGPVPDAYNLFSRPVLARNAAFSDLAWTPAYVLVPMESKRTAGVEFLATIGQGASARDYLGLEPRAGSTPPLSSNRTLLVTLYRVAAQPDRIRVKLAGLNPADGAHLVLELIPDDRPPVTVATLTADGETSVTVSQPFRMMILRAVDNASGREIGVASIQHDPRPAGEARPLDPTLPSNASSVFVTDLVLSRDTSQIGCEGLLPIEGPFPQWDIPYIRWTRVPVVRLTIPPTKDLARLQVSYSLRLHVRKEGRFAVYFNGRLVQQHALQGQLKWLDQTLDLVPQAGENVLEFRDATYKVVPDWLDYLERYPDVKNHLLTQQVPLAEGAREHYESHGRAEGRTVQQRETTELEPAYESYYYMFRNLRLEGFKSP